MTAIDEISLAERAGRMPWVMRAVIALFVIGAVAVVWLTNHLLTDRLTDTTRNRAELRLVLYAGNVASELQRNSVVPLLLARDPALIGALQSGDFSVTTQRLMSCLLYTSPSPRDS